MNAQQNKETALRAATAVDRARATVTERIRVAQQRAAARKSIQGMVSKKEGPDQALLHVTPLFGPIDALDLTGPIVDRLKAIPVFGYSDRIADHRLALEGLYREIGSGADVLAYNLFLRNGAIEFQEYDILLRAAPEEGGKLWFRARLLEDDVIETITHVRSLTEAGILPLPALVSLTLLEVQGSILNPGWPRTRMFSPQPASDSSIVAIDPILITDWSDDPARSMKRLFDIMWQAWGWPSSGSYDNDGNRKPIA